jgi:hypothetical protein
MMYRVFLDAAEMLMVNAFLASVSGLLYMEFL